MLQEVKVPRCKASTRKGLIPRVPTKTKIDAQSVVIQDAHMKHGVRICGCNFTKCLLQIGREKQWFQSQFQTACGFYKFCQAGDIF